MDHNFGDQFRNWTGTIVFKGIVTLFLGLLVLIPIGQIKDLLRERENRMFTVKDEVISMWGGWQYILSDFSRSFQFSRISIYKLCF